MANVVVVGAGMGGMATAARLSAQGHRVQVLEQSATYGGKLAGFERDGFRFDVGPSLLTLPAVYRDLFLKTAVSRRDASLEDNVDLQALDPAFGYRWADRTQAVLPGANTNRVAQALGEALGATAAADWRRLCERGAALWAATRVPFLESPITSPWQFASQLRSVGNVRTVAPWKSLRGIGEQYLGDRRLRQLLDRYATYAGSDPRRAPAALAVIPYVEQTFGAWHVGGGLHELATALHRRCLARDVEFTFDAPVGQITTNSSGVTGICLADDRHVPAEIVVANADAANVYSQLVDDSRGQKPLRKLRKAVPSMSAFTMSLAIRGRTPDVQHHNVSFPNEHRRRVRCDLWQITSTGRRPDHLCLLPG